MLKSVLVRTWMSLVLSAMLLASTLPISAADFSTHTLGSVSSVGDVALRGVPMGSEGTLFSGDRIRTGNKSYAKLALQNANSLELFTNTQAVVTDAKPRVTVGLLGGNIAFAASKEPVAITMEDYEILPAAGTTGGVSFVSGTDFGGIRVIKGGVTIRNVKDNRSVTIGSDDVQVINLKTDEMNVPVGQLVRALPPSALPAGEPLPAAAAVMSGLSTAQRIILLAMIGGEAAAIGFTIIASPN